MSHRASFVVLMSVLLFMKTPFITLKGFTLQVSLFMQEGIQVDGARVVLPQPVSNGPTPPVGTLTTYPPDGMLALPDV